MLAWERLYVLLIRLRYVKVCITKYGFVEKSKMGKKEKLVNAIVGRAKEIDGRKKLACAEAFELAQQFKAEVAEIGRICNQHNIKIRKCQLGCFR